MRKTGLKVILILVCICLAAALAGCGAVVLTRPAKSDGAASVAITGSCNMSLENGVITITGQTNIMDGALLQIAVVGQDGLTVDSKVITKSGDQISQSFNISEKYKDIKTVFGFITCAPSQYGAQPDGVYNSYGRKFENITADNDNYQWDGGGNIIIFQSAETIDLTN